MSKRQAKKNTPPRTTDPHGPQRGPKPCPSGASPGRGVPTSFRPIPARMLKSIGDTLRPHFQTSHVVDLYAGEGRFGSVALSEGAHRVEFVESHPKLAKQLQQQAAPWGEKAVVHCTDVGRFLQSTESVYEIIFADPPFDSMTEASLTLLASQVAPVLAKEGIFLVKHPARMLISGLLSSPITGFECWKTSAVGDAGLTYFIRV